MNDVNYSILNTLDLANTILNNFNRYQETNEQIIYDNNKYTNKRTFFIDDWKEEKKVEVINNLRQSVLNGGIVIGAFINDILKGFICIEGEFFGVNKEYLELSYIHVSRELRGKGIGRKLIKLGSIEAKNKGANKLYIGAHPSVETQRFYKSIGCVKAIDINKDIYMREPLDIQLELNL